LRVAFVAPGGLGTPTGGYVYDRHAVEALRRRHEVELVTVPPRASGVFEAVRLSCRSRRGFDVVVQDALCAEVLAPVNPTLGVPVVGIVHLLAKDDPREGAVSRATDTAYLGTLDSCVYTSRATERSSPSETDSVVAHPASRFSPDVTERDVRRKAHREGLHVAFVGDISPVKGLDRLVRAVSEVPECTVTVAGRVADRRYLRRVRRLCSALGVPDRVEFVGVLSRDGLVSVFGEADAVAVPSRHEAFGTAYIEGMSFGLPAVAPASGGADELIEDGKNGFLLRDDTDLVRALRTLTEDGFLARAGVEALEAERDWVSWEGTTRKVVEHVERTAKG
jgi:glycosyltransferase involved in cell wall biosynthesis